VRGAAAQPRGRASASRSAAPPRLNRYPRPHPDAAPSRPDVANAVLDGVDGILLGQETLRGGYPIEAVQTVVSICKQVRPRGGR
jgi:hypothetical protein